MKIIIMAAGKGQRFRDEGFFFPKPLIQVREVPIIELAIKEAASVVGIENVIVLSTSEVCKYLAFSEIKVPTVQVDVIQQGPAMSVLLCGGKIEQDEPVILMDCDVLFNNWKGILESIVTDISGYYSIVVTTEVPEEDVKKYSTVMLNWNKEVVAIAEKQNIGSNLACTGIYAFNNWGDYVFSLAECIVASAVSKEIYISNVVSNVIPVSSEGGFSSTRVGCIEIPPEDWICLGTPQQFLLAMERYNEKY